MKFLACLFKKKLVAPPTIQTFFVCTQSLIYNSDPEAYTDEFFQQSALNLHSIDANGTLFTDLSTAQQEQKTRGDQYVIFQVELQKKSDLKTLQSEAIQSVYFHKNFHNTLGAYINNATTKAGMHFNSSKAH